MLVRESDMPIVVIKQGNAVVTWSEVNGGMRCCVEDQ